MRLPLLVTLTLWLACFVCSVQAAPPDVKWVFPTGGQIGQKVTVKVSGKINQPGTQVWCDNPNVVFEIPEKDNDLVISPSADARPGLYWLRFFNAEGATAQMPFVLGRLPEVVEAEPNNDVAKAQPIDQSIVINGKLGAADDVDVYAVALKKGQTLVAQIDANWRLGFPVDPIMQVLSANGTVIEQVDDDHGFDPLIAFEAPSDGTWLVRVFGFPAAPNSTIRFAGGTDYVYRLTLTTGPIANHAVPSAVQRGSEASVQLSGWNLSDVLSQPIKIDVGTLPGFTHAELPHDVSLSIVDEPVQLAVEPCNAEKPLAVTVPTTVCGVIDEAGDEDSFRFSAKKGEVLVIDVESRSLGYPLDTVVTVFDKDGKSLGESDDAVRNKADSRLVFSVKADGDYTLRIRDLFENGDWRFAYRLSIRLRQPSVSLTLKADAFNATLGTPLEIPVTIARNDGFAEEVMVSVQNLPEGATVEPVKSEAKGDTSKAVKLILKTDDAKPFNGPLRIVGQYGDGSSVNAEFDLATFNRSTEDIWLTILPKKEEAKAKAD
ncbi:MAG: pre-peptidase C-terminal domain-containing protein [Rhodopirellula sp.]|nr:pre-peptidase C-terminal domain-containing protein [Rhodopirellula sp.]